MNKSLREELLRMRELDQEAAAASFQASEREPRFRGKFLFQIPREEWVEQFVRAAEIAERHAARLRDIFAEYGWPGRSLVGEDGAEVAWLLLQHGGPDLQRLYPVLGGPMRTMSPTGMNVLAFMVPAVWPAQLSLRPTSPSALQPRGQTSTAELAALLLLVGQQDDESFPQVQSTACRRN